MAQRAQAYRSKLADGFPCSTKENLQHYNRGFTQTWLADGLSSVVQTSGAQNMVTFIHVSSASSPREAVNRMWTYVDGVVRTGPRVGVVISSIDARTGEGDER